MSASFNIDYLLTTPMNAHEIVTARFEHRPSKAEWLIHWQRGMDYYEDCRPFDNNFPQLFRDYAEYIENKIGGEVTYLGIQRMM